MNNNNRIPFPFVAIVGQEKMKKALVLNVINPGLSGVLIRGEKGGTAKSTAVRALAEILSEISTVEGCPFQCDPDNSEFLCRFCKCKVASGDNLVPHTRKVRVIDGVISIIKSFWMN
mgnify:CR=1 FL=1